MRILRLLTVFALCAGIAGCSGAHNSQPKSPLSDHTGSYDAEVAIRRGTFSAAASISRQAPNSCSVSFTSPEALADMAFVFSQDSVNVGYKGLSFRIDPRSVPGGAVAEIIVEAMNMAILDNGVSINATDQGVELTGVLDTGQFILRMNPQNSSVTKLSVPSEDLEIEFLSFRFLD